MRVIIAGSRDITDLKVVSRVMEAARALGIVPTAVVCGMARGVDMLGHEWAESQGIPVHEYPADWSKGKSAGLVRNYRMARNADALVAIWDGQSKGTANMIATAKRLRLKTHTSIQLTEGA